MTQYDTANIVDLGDVRTTPVRGAWRTHVALIKVDGASKLCQLNHQRIHILIDFHDTRVRPGIATKEVEKLVMMAVAKQR